MSCWIGWFLWNGPRSMGFPGALYVDLYHEPIASVLRPFLRVPPSVRALPRWLQGHCRTTIACRCKAVLRATIGGLVDQVTGMTGADTKAAVMARVVDESALAVAMVVDVEAMATVMVADAVGLGVA